MFCITSASFSHPSKACFVRTSILPKVPFTMRGRKKAQTISFLFMLSSFHRTKSSFHLGFLFLKFISHGKKIPSYTTPLRNIGESGQEFRGRVFVCAHIWLFLSLLLLLLLFCTAKRPNWHGRLSYLCVGIISVFTAFTPSLSPSLPFFWESPRLGCKWGSFSLSFCPLIPCSSDLNTTWRICFLFILYFSYEFRG